MKRPIPLPRIFSKHHNTFLLPVFLLLSLTSCHTQSQPPVLQGKVRMSEEWRPRLYLVQPAGFRQILSSYEGKVVDSVDIGADGRFAFKAGPWLQKPGVFVLFIQEKTGKYPQEIKIPAHRENYICLKLTPGNTVELESEAGHLARSYTLLQADSDTRLMQQLRDLRAPIFAEAEKQAQEQAADTLQTFHTESATAKTYRESLEHFIDTCKAFYPTLVAVRYLSPDNEYRSSPELHVAACARLRERAEDPALAEQFCFYCSPERLPVLKGEKCPDYKLPGLRGDTLQISKIKGKLILLDFWASWCAPCRKEIRETMVPLYAEYHEKGFEIAGISIDSSPESWRNAIQRDGATWPQGCDLEGDASPVRDELRFVYIPGNYLLDSEGRLLARNLHGAELRAFVEEYFRK